MRTPPTTQPEHVRRIRDLPGRLRAEVKGLRGNPRLAQRAERTLGALAGVRRVEANPLTGRVLILYAPGLTDLHVLLAEVTKLESSRAPRVSSRVQAPSTTLPRRPVRGSAFLLAEALQPIVAGALFIGIALKVLLVGHHERAQSERLNALSVLVGTLSGYPQMRRATRRVLGRGTPVGLVAGYLSIGIKGLRESLLGLSADTGSHLFEYLEMSALRRTRRQLNRLLHHHGRARLMLAAGREIHIPVTELQPGELIRVEAGERIPADGVVEDGTGLADESVLTHRRFSRARAREAPRILERGCGKGRCICVCVRWAPRRMSVSCSDGCRRSAKAGFHWDPRAGPGVPALEDSRWLPRCGCCRAAGDARWRCWPW
jgi:cation transport ATPase